MSRSQIRSLPALAGDRPLSLFLRPLLPLRRLFDHLSSSSRLSFCPSLSVSPSLSSCSCPAAALRALQCLVLSSTAVDSRRDPPPDLYAVEHAGTGALSGQSPTAAGPVCRTGAHQPHAGLSPASRSIQPSQNISTVRCRSAYRLSRPPISSPVFFSVSVAAFQQCGLHGRSWIISWFPFAPSFVCCLSELLWAPLFPTGVLSPGRQLRELLQPPL
ncbi:hypothetical protein VTN02DRAFT_4468 [Thermoascus thermophilus]